MRKTLLILSLGLFFLVQTGGICRSQTTERVSVDSVGAEALGPSFAPSISENGRYVAFESDYEDLVADDDNTSRDIFVHDRDADGDGIYDDEDGTYDPGEVSTVRVSVDSAEIQGNNHSYSPSISADGRHVAFESDSDDLVVGDNNNFRDIFVRNLQTKTTTRVSVNSAGAESNDPSNNPSISADGRYVAFRSGGELDLTATEIWLLFDVFVHDRDADEDGIYDEPSAVSIVRVSEDSDRNEADGASGFPSISSDGRYVAFESFATNLVANDTNTAVDIFVRDRDADGDGIYDDEDGTHDPGEVSTVRVSVDSDGKEATGGDSSSCSISSGGRYVAFESSATNLVADDTNGWSDIFVHDRDADGDGIYDDEDGTYDFGEVSTVRASVHSTRVQGNGNSNFPSISSDGRYVTFMSDASNLVDDDTNANTDIFVHDLQTGATTRVSVDSDGSEAIGGDTSSCSISSDGNYVAFESFATNLVANDTNGEFDIFVYEQDPPPPNTTQSENNNSSGSGSCFIATAASDWVDF
jgi:Tol biopolymer transport system component